MIKTTSGLGHCGTDTPQDAGVIISYRRVTEGTIKHFSGCGAADVKTHATIRTSIPIETHLATHLSLTKKLAQHAWAITSVQRGSLNAARTVCA